MRLSRCVRRSHTFPFTRDRSLYRHNFEYDFHALLALTKAAGFNPVSIETLDTFNTPNQKGARCLEGFGLPARLPRRQYTSRMHLALLRSNETQKNELNAP